MIIYYKLEKDNTMDNTKRLGKEFPVNTLSFTNVYIMAHTHKWPSPPIYASGKSNSHKMEIL